MKDSEVVELARIRASSYRTAGGGTFSQADQSLFVEAFEILYGIAMMGLPNTAFEQAEDTADLEEDRLWPLQ